MPINGDEFIKSMESFIDSNRQFVGKTDTLIRRLDVLIAGKRDKFTAQSVGVQNAETVDKAEQKIMNTENMVINNVNKIIINNAKVDGTFEPRIINNGESVFTKKESPLEDVKGNTFLTNELLIDEHKNTEKRHKGLLGTLMDIPLMLLSGLEFLVGLITAAITGLGVTLLAAWSIEKISKAIKDALEAAKTQAEVEKTFKDFQNKNYTITYIDLINKGYSVEEANKIAQTNYDYNKISQLQYNPLARHNVLLAGASDVLGNVSTGNWKGAWNAAMEHRTDYQGFENELFSRPDIQEKFPELKEPLLMVKGGPSEELRNRIYEYEQNRLQKEMLSSRKYNPLITQPVPTSDYDDIIDKYAQQYGLNSDILKSQINQESGGRNIDPKTGKIITSSAGAQGLMQLMPSTAQEIAKELNEPYNENSLSDPETNVRWGAYYLKKQLEKYGNYPQALAAYNAGPGAVDRAINKGQFIPAYKETTDYVSKISGMGFTEGLIQQLGLSQNNAANAPNNITIKNNSLQTELGPASMSIWESVKTSIDEMKTVISKQKGSSQYSIAGSAD